MGTLHIREASIQDASTILGFINDLAIYEKEPDAVKATIKDIEATLFSKDSTAHAIICLLDDEPVGFAVYFFNYSTWLGKNGLYLEDLYVSSEHRKMGAGKAILKYLAQLAVSKNCGRFEWCVLDWNQPAIDFYEAIGAEAQDEWVIYRLTGDALTSFANA